MKFDSIANRQTVIEITNIVLFDFWGTLTCFQLGPFALFETDVLECHSSVVENQTG